MNFKDLQNKAIDTHRTPYDGVNGIMACLGAISLDLMQARGKMDHTHAKVIGEAVAEITIYCAKICNHWGIDYDAVVTEDVEDTL